MALTKLKNGAFSTRQQLQPILDRKYRNIITRRNKRRFTQFPQEMVFKQLDEPCDHKQLVNRTIRKINDR